MNKVVSGLPPGKNTEGFTIVETLIVLAVSAVMAVSALALVNGSQNKTQFRVAALDLKQQLEQIVNETRNGYYPKNSTFTCTKNASGPLITAGSKDQGSHSDCIFLGKAVAFGIGATGADREAYAVLPIVGNRLNTGLKPVTSFAESGSTPLRSAISTGVTHNGLTFRNIQYSPAIDGVSSSPDYAVVGFLDSLNQYAVDPDDGQVGSSVQTLNLYAMRHMSSWNPSTATQVADGIATGNVANGHGPNDDAGVVLNSATLCFDSGGTRQSAVYTISGKGQLSVTLTINNAVCS